MSSEENDIEVSESIMYKEIDKAVLLGVLSGMFATLAVVHGMRVMSFVIFVGATITYFIARYVGHRRLFYLVEAEEEEEKKCQ